jgi:hypothetical protein
VGDRCPREQDRRKDVDAEHEFGLLERAVEESADPAGDAGVVHETRDGAELGDRRRHDRRGLLEIGQVDAEQHDAGAGCLACARDLRSLRLALAVHEDEVVAVGGETLGDRRTDAAARAGDDRDRTGRGIRVHDHQPKPGVMLANAGRAGVPSGHGTRRGEPA